MGNIWKQLYNSRKKALKETMELQVPNYLNNGFIEKIMVEVNFLSNYMGWILYQYRMYSIKSQ